ncbi:hypothetical protein ACFQOZ_20870 [Comamonas endophytica]|uniref:hypothetical protein n=1 Tax=Comamonas endophytica TaxID=2949090 RepID=UPI0036078585
MNGFLGFLPLLLMLIFGIALWALGQFLRRRGWGERLDFIDTRLRKAQAIIGRFSAILGLAWLGAGSALSHTPYWEAKVAGKFLTRLNHKKKTVDINNSNHRFFYVSKVLHYRNGVNYALQAESTDIKGNLGNALPSGTA